MGLPSRKELDSIMKELESIEPTKLLPKNASKSDRLKYDLCKQFVVYLRHNNLSQAELARQLKIDTARLNEIVKYKIELFTVDKLLEYVERLNPEIKVIVA